MASLTVLGWLLSLFWTLKWDWVFGLLGAGLALGLAIRWAGSLKQLRAGLAEPLAWWPFILLMLLIFLGGVIYPPTMLDSLTYRLPRIFAWLQEGHIMYLPSVEERMNYMPHSWSLCILPVLQLFNDHLVCAWSFASWVVLCLVAYDWAFELGGDQARSRQMAFIAAATTFAVLQAESSANDLFAVAQLLLMVRFVLEYERTRNWREINWAVLCLCLAAGTKPQFTFFGLPLILWFFLSPSRPWQAFRWLWAPVLMVLWLACSPAPSFWINSQVYGTLTGPGQDYSMTGKGPYWNWLLGSTMVAWQSFQPPISPFGLAHKSLEKVVEHSGLRQAVPRFNLRVAAVGMVDSATLGLVAAVMFVAGSYLALKRRAVGWWAWQSLALAAGLVCLLMALAKIVPENSGRAFCGFLYFGLPLAMVGWNLMPPKWLNLGFSLSLATALIAVILTPSRPLWPAGWAHKQLAKHERFNRLAGALEPYFKYSERAHTAREIINEIPQTEPQFVALVGGDRPLLPLFRPYCSGRKVIFLRRDARPMELEYLKVNFVIVGGGADEMYPELCQYLKTNCNYYVMASHDYTSKIVRGAETWQLYHRNQVLTALADAAAKPH